MTVWCADLRGTAFLNFGHALTPASQFNETHGSNQRCHCIASQNGLLWQLCGKLAAVAFGDYAMKTLPMLTSTLRSANSRLIRAMLFGRQNDCQYLDRLNANGQIRFGGASEGVSAASVDFPDNHRLLLRVSHAPRRVTEST